MYPHQSMSRSMSGGQLNNPMISHPGMVMSSAQMINTPQGVMVSQAGYPQGMLQTGQPPPQMMSSQGHMGQPMMMQMSQGGHMSQQQMQMSQVAMGGQQGYMQQQGVPSHPGFPGSLQARSPAINSQTMSQGTPQGPPSVGGPPSNNPQTPLNTISNLNPASQQVPTPATPQQAPSSVQSSSQEPQPSAPTVIPPDPVAIAKNMALKDLRHTIQDWSKALAEVIRPPAARQQQDAASAVHNPMSVNPQSVNPQSVNPQSVNPLSVNPSSVKSLDEPKSVEATERLMTPNETYLHSLDNFLSVCKQIEKNVMTVQEFLKQSARFEKMSGGDLKSSGESGNYMQYAQGYVDAMERSRSALIHTITNMKAKMRQLNQMKNAGTIEEEPMES